MKDYTANYEKIKDIKQQARRDIESLPRSVTSNGCTYPIKPEFIEAQAAKIQTDADTEVRAEVEFILNSISTDMEAAQRELAAAEPMPTSDDIALAGQIVKDYNNSHALLMEKAAAFKKELQRHLDARSPKAQAYALASRELFPSEHVDYDSFLNPDILDKRQTLEALEQQETEYKIFLLEQRGANPEQLTHSERVAIKTELFKLGAKNPNIF